VVIPFFSFRIMVGCGVIMLLIAWVGSYLIRKERIEQNRLLLWATFLSFPLPYIAILTGWITAEVGRQPWVVFGVLRTADAMTPFLTARTATVSLAVYCVVYSFIFSFGTYYIYRLLRTGPAGSLVAPTAAAVPTVRCRSLMSTARHRLLVTSQWENSNGHVLGGNLELIEEQPAALVTTDTPSRHTSVPCKRLGQDPTQAETGGVAAAQTPRITPGQQRHLVLIPSNANPSVRRCSARVLPPWVAGPNSRG